MYKRQAVDINKDGTRIVIGSHGESRYGYYSGAVRVYESQNQYRTKWTQVGNTIYGSQANEIFGNNVEISDDGDRILISGEAGGLNEKGFISVYKLTSNKKRWYKFANEIRGLYTHGNFGYKMAMSGDGETICGINRGGTGGEWGYHARIFKNPKGDIIYGGEKYQKNDIIGGRLPIHYNVDALTNFEILKYGKFKQHIPFNNDTNESLLGPGNKTIVYKVLTTMSSNNLLQNGYFTDGKDSSNNLSGSQNINIIRMKSPFGKSDYVLELSENSTYSLTVAGLNSESSYILSGWTAISNSSDLDISINYGFDNATVTHPMFSGNHDGTSFNDQSSRIINTMVIDGIKWEHRTKQIEAGSSSIKWDVCLLYTSPSPRD